jgi:uncharacterized membrane protein
MARAVQSIVVMSIVIGVALVVCLLGAVVYLVPNKAGQPNRFSQLGLYAWAVGLWWVLDAIGPAAQLAMK